jgi:hypothetical protein
MPLVFVHGVNVRRDADYEAAERVRDELFRTVSLKGIADAPGFSLFNPYWGDHGATFPYSYGFIPGNQVEAFGAALDPLAASAMVDAHIEGARPSPESSLVALARQSLPDAIDALVAYTAQTSGAEDVSASLVRFGAQAHEYARSQPKPGWLDKVTNNTQFVDLLSSQVDTSTPPPAVETFGAISDLRNALTKASVALGQRLVDVMVDPFAPAAKRLALLRFSRFFGDVFCYINEKHEKEENRVIRSTVRNDLERAETERIKTGHKLIVVGHSMGGNIAYDLLSKSASGVKVDLFLTVGSQVGLFEELKLFDASIQGCAKVKRPPNVTHWLNVYDPSDPFGYAIERIFANGTDFTYDTNVSPISAHSAYLYKPGFHRRLAERIQEIFRP